VLVVSLLVLVPRSAYIASVHSECIDDEYHLVRGVRFLTGKLDRSPLNDPVLGSAVMALPLWLADVKPNINAKRGDNVYKYGQVLHGQKVPVETLTMRVAIWKSILFVPCVLLAFVWVRRLYNERAAWVAAALLLIEPTISAHVAPAALDVLGFEAILVACFCWWRYFEKQTWLRLIPAAVVSAAAMLVKHTAIIVPIVALIYAVAWWIKRWRDARGCSPSSLAGEGRREGAGNAPVVRGDDRVTTPAPAPLARGGEWKIGSRLSLRRDLIHAMFAILVAAVALHYLSGGSVQIRRPDSIAADSMIGKLFERPMPAGYYIKSIQTAMYHGGEGHPSWLLGERNDEGSWYYYPVVALYKVPIALLVFLALGALSLIKVRPRFGELALLVPMVLLMALITTGGINIGFRHAIPAYALLLMLCCRVMLIDIRWLRTLIVALVAITLLDTARYFPNLISYINFPREKVWMDINDSNLDWGQGLKQINKWCEQNYKPYGGHGFYVRYFGLDYSPNVEHYLNQTYARRIPRNAGPPDHGILIISPIYIAGMFEKPGLYDFLRTEEPIAIIGDSNLVFDLDEIYLRRPETRPAPTTAPTE
jgi:hypothetical protein